MKHLSIYGQTFKGKCESDVTEGEQAASSPPASRSQEAACGFCAQQQQAGAARRRSDVNSDREKISF